MKNKIRCIYCGKKTRADMPYCNNCAKYIGGGVGEGAPTPNPENGTVVFEPKYCPTCKVPVNLFEMPQEGTWFCMNCGNDFLKKSPVTAMELADIESGRKSFCPQCGGLYGELDMFCNNCGTRLRDDGPFPPIGPYGEITYSCPRCGKPVSEQGMLCEECNAINLGSPEPGPIPSLPPIDYHEPESGTLNPKPMPEPPIPEPLEKAGLINTCDIHENPISTVTSVENHACPRCGKPVSAEGEICQACKGLENMQHCGADGFDFVTEI